MRTLHEMDCKNCKHSKIMKAGTYQLSPGTIMNLANDSWKCTCKKIETMDVSGEKSRCSNFEERDPE